MKIIGFIFAAGLGTRLKPLTNNKPKALVKVDGKTLIDNAIETLNKYNVRDIIINVHHFADQIIEHVKQTNYDAKIMVSDERAYLRETAGGIKFAIPFWDDYDAVLIYNVDVISSINISHLIDYHINNNNSATLAVRNRATSRYFLFDKSDNQLCGWTNQNSGEKIIISESDNIRKLAFSGIHILNTELARKILSPERFSITKFYLQHSDKHKIKAYIHDDDSWEDVGKFELFKNRLS